MVKYAKILALALLTLVLASAVFAQAPGGGGSGQFAQFREQHKYTFQLMQMTHHIEAIDRDPKYALTADQAKKVLAVLKPLQSKPTLTQDQAKDVLKKLKPIFTVTQLNAMAKIKEPPRFGGQRPGGGAATGGAPGGGFRPGGNGGPGGRPHMDMARMKDFNPFYTKVDKKDDFSAMRAKRWNDFFSHLDAKAKGTKATSAKKPIKAKAKK